MKETFLLIQNISIQSKAPNDIIKMIDEVRGCLEDVFSTIKKGEKQILVIVAN